MTSSSGSAPPRSRRGGRRSRGSSSAAGCLRRRAPARRRAPPRLRRLRLPRPRAASASGCSARSASGCSPRAPRPRAARPRRSVPRPRTAGRRPRSPARRPRPARESRRRRRPRARSSSGAPGSRSSANIRLPPPRLGLLRGVRMVGPRVDLQLAQLRAAEPAAGQHPLDGEPDDLLRPAREHLLERAAAQAAGIAGMPVVALLVRACCRHGDLLGVDHDHEVAHVHMRACTRACACRAARPRSGSRGGRASCRSRRRPASCARACRVSPRRSSLQESGRLRGGRREQCSTPAQAASRLDRRPA